VPEWVSTTAARHMRDPLSVHLEAGHDAPAPDIDHVVYELEPTAKFEALMKLLDERPSSVLVFGRTKHGVKKLAKQLAARGYPVGALQGNLAQGARERAIAAFRSGELPILCATNVAARGLDIDGIGQVINYELPESADLFTHRAGRTGRMGRKGEAITFVTPDDAAKLRQIEKRLERRLTSSGQLPAAPLPAVPRPPKLQNTAAASRPKRFSRRYA
jgi:ATP-dependent RNA helicase DeaD